MRNATQAEPLETPSSGDCSDPAFGGSHGAMAGRVIRLAPGLPAHLARSVQVNVRLGKGPVGTELECN
jgi:hypothetical protein